MMARTIAKAEETANRNIKNLSSPKAHHPIIIPSYIRFWDSLTNYGFKGGNF